MYILKILIFLYFFIYSICVSFGGYPESMTTIDQLLYDNADRTLNIKEYFIVGIQPNSITNNIYFDKKLGVPFFPISISKFTIDTCELSVSYYSGLETTTGGGSDDRNWNNISYHFSFNLPHKTLISNHFVIIGEGLIELFDPGNLHTLTGSDISDYLKLFNLNSDLLKLNSTIFNYYFWIKTNTTLSNIIFNCIDSCSVVGSILSYNYEEMIENSWHQIFLRNYRIYTGDNYDNYFYILDKVRSIKCNSKQFKVSLSKPNAKLYISAIKLSVYIEKNLNCESNELICPPYSICAQQSDGSKICVKDSLLARNLTSENIKIPGRFCKEYNNLNNLESGYCLPEYFNIQPFKKLIFPFSPPIKSGAATLSFWFFLYKPEFKNYEDIFHIVLDDFFVVTFILEKDISNINYYIIYLTVYEMYHEAYNKKKLYESKTKTEFLEIIETFPFKNWYIKYEVKKLNRWVYFRFNFNQHKSSTDSTKAQMVIIHNLDPINGHFYKVSQKIDNEYIYKEKDIQSEIHFKRFYRNDDKMNVRIINENFNLYLFLKYLYVINGDIPIEQNTNGFQYHSFENIFKDSNIKFPELLLAIPFDDLIYSSGKYSFPYYYYDSNNLIVTKQFEFNGKYLESELYNFPNELYRLQLIMHPNHVFENDDLDEIENADTSDYFRYNGNYYYSCYSSSSTTNSILNNENQCVSYCVNGYNLLPGYVNNAGRCSLTCDTDLCVRSNTFTCNTGARRFYEDCYYSSKQTCTNCNKYTSSHFRGSLYYNSFYKLPPFYINVISTGCKNFKLTFNFMFETNTALIYGQNYKNQKIYIFYSDGFRIWHDYNLTYLGVEDENNYNSKNIIPFFNKYNLNKFVISVSYSDNIYKGTLYLNENQQNKISFNANSLSYIVFCHLDNYCPAGGNIYWTNGFYDNIKFFNLDTYSYVYDSMIYTMSHTEEYNNYLSQINNIAYNPFYLYNSITYLSSFFYLDQNKHTYFYEGTTESILNTLPDDYDVITSYDSIAQYNVGIMQKIPNRISDNIPESNKYIDSNYNDATCTCNKCYGSGNTFSDECNICNSDEAYYKNSNCESYPTSTKGYYVLSLPHPIYRTNPLVFSTDFSNKKITISFWLKLYGMKTSNEIPFLYCNRFRLNFQISDSSAIVYFKIYVSGSYSTIASYDYSKRLGKYTHFSIVFSYNKRNSAGSSGNISRDLSLFHFLINNEYINVNSFETSNTKDIDFSNIYIDNDNFYVYLARFKYYEGLLIGAYAFETNSYLNYIFNNLINPEFEACSTNDVNIKCIQDYSNELNPDYYINNKKMLYLNENGDIKKYNCHKSCKELCYSTSENDCACTLEGYYSYFGNYNMDSTEYSGGKCMPLPAINFDRYSSITFIFSLNTEILNYNKLAFNFWFLFSPEWNPYTNSKNVIQVNVFNTNIIFRDNLYVYLTTINNSYRTNYSKNRWQNLKVYYKNGYIHLQIDSNSEIIKSGYPSINNEITYTMHTDIGNSYSGFYFIRQFKIYNSDDYYNTYYNKEIINTYNRDWLIAVIDSTLNEDNTFSIYSKYSEYISIDAYEKSEEASTYSGFAYNTKRYVLLDREYCSEYFSCSSIPNLVAFKDISISNIIPSSTSRYTIDMWIKVSNSEKFLYGVNIIWTGHMSISVLNDNTKVALTYLCFPQDYLNTTNGLIGRKVLNMAKYVLNKDSFNLDIENYDNTWVYLRCAYNWDNELYYLKSTDNLNDLYPAVEKNINKENTFPGYKVDYPFKRFFSSKTNLIIQNAALNVDSSVSIRNIYLFNDYLPPEFDTSRMKMTLTNFVDYLVFGIDFSTYSTGYVINYMYKNENNVMLQNNVNLNIENSDINPTSTGYVYLCNNNQYYNKQIGECETITCSTIDANAEISYNCKNLKCKNNYFLIISSNTCESTCLNSGTLNRGPGGITTSGICNYICNENFESCNQYITNYDSNLKCKSDYSRVGFKCLNKEEQKNAAIYFSSCYNFHSLYKNFQSLEITAFNQSYAIEVWFKLDFVNNFCDEDIYNSFTYVLYTYPHALVQIKNTYDIYYKDNYSDSEPVKLNSISLYEWNHVVILYNKNKGLIQVYVNFNTEPDYSKNIEENINNDYYLRALAFCNGNFKCDPLLTGTDINIKWTSAYYKKIRFYNTLLTSIHMINEYALNKIQYHTTSEIIYYEFNNINNDLNTFYNELNKDITSNILQFSIDGNWIYNLNDTILLYLSSSNFDWGEKNGGFYVTNVEKFSGKVSYKKCADNCKRCYDSSKYNCYECNENYIFYNKQCRKMTGYYMQFPNNLLNNIDVNVNNNNFNISNINPLTVTIWIKFFGFHYNKTQNNILNFCKLIVQISKQNSTYLCYDTNDNILYLNYNNTINLYSLSNFNETIGKWLFISFSNFNTKFNDTSSYFPNIFSFSYNNLIVPRSDTFKIDNPGIYIDSISFGYGLSASISDIRFYSNFILNPYGIVSNDESYEKYLIYNLKLFSTDSNNCISSNILTSDSNDISNIITCTKDYLIQHDMSNYNCDKNIDKMIDNNDKDNICIDCIDDCYYCGGDSKLNCACYFNDNYWIRKDISSNQLFCEVLPYPDFNTYSEIIFDDVKYSNTNEYSIEFWYYVYEYNKDNINFKKQTIEWSKHNKIIISYLDNNHLKVDCYPILYTNESLYTSDVDSNEYFKWNHIICSTNINKKLFYLNELEVQNLDNNNVEFFDFSNFIDSKTNLIFTNEESDITSHGIFFIREVRLWNFYSVREFPTECKYDINYYKKYGVPFLLNYFNFEYNKNGKIEDSLGNEPSSIKKKNNLIGYNLVDYNNEINFKDINDKLCLFVESLPNVGYFNKTYFLLKEYYLLNKGDFNYTYKYYISENANHTFDEIETNYLKHDSQNLKNSEYLLEKFTNLDFNDTQINIYLTAIDENSNIYIGFCPIIIKYYSKNNDIFYKNYISNFIINLSVDSNDLSSKYLFTHTEIVNRLYILKSLVDIYDINENKINSTHTFLNFNKNENNESFISNISIENPICNESFCSFQGDCFVVVRKQTCFCYEKYTGFNCHLTVDNKNYLQDLHLLFWNYFTNNNNLNSLNSEDFNLNLINYVLFLIKSCLKFSEFNNILIQNFYDFIDYVIENYSLILNEKYTEFFEIFGEILNEFYNEINYKRVFNNVTLNENRILNEIIMINNSLNSEQTNEFKEHSLKIMKYIKTFIKNYVIYNKNDISLYFESYNIEIKNISNNFDYKSYFLNLLFKNRYFDHGFYETYFDALNCNSEIFKTNSNIYLILIEYKYNPFAYKNEYINSASYLNDIYFLDSNGDLIEILNCKQKIDIYFPINLYNETNFYYLKDNKQFINKHLKIKNEDTYFTYPVYVHKNNGSVLKKSREERINEFLPKLNVFCVYYNYSNEIKAIYKNVNITDDYFFKCSSSHFGLYNIIIKDTNEKFSEDGKFFWLKCWYVIKGIKNYFNYSLILFYLLIIIFVVCLKLLDKKDEQLMKEKNLLENIKKEIIKENRLFSIKIDREIDENIINNEFNKIDKMKNQEKMEKDLNINKKKDIKIYKKNQYDKFSISSSDNLNNEINNNNNNNLKQTKTTFSNPPKKSKNNNNNNNDNNNNKTSPFKYRIKDYDPDFSLDIDKRYYFKEEEFDNKNYDEDGNYIEPEKEPSNNNYSEDSRIKRLRIRNEEEEKYYNNKMSDLNFSEFEKKSDDYENSYESNNLEKNDFFSKNTKIKSGIALKTKKIYAKNGNFGLNDQFKKVLFINEKEENVHVTNLIEDLEKKNYSFCEFFILLLKYRQIYFVNFYLTSTLNPRSKKLFCLFIYLIFQLILLIFSFSFVEDIKFFNKKIVKIFILQFFVVFVSNFLILGLIPFFKISSNEKKLLFKTLESNQQMKLIEIWKEIKKNQRKKNIFGMILFILIIIICFYFLLNYCSILYFNVNTFILTFFVGIFIDFLFYESFIIFLICVCYKKRKNEKIKKIFNFLFNYRTFRCCC